MKRDNEFMSNYLFTHSHRRIIQIIQSCQINHFYVIYFPVNIWIQKNSLRLVLHDVGDADAFYWRTSFERERGRTIQHDQVVISITVLVSTLRFSRLFSWTLCHERRAVHWYIFPRQIVNDSIQSLSFCDSATYINYYTHPISCQISVYVFDRGGRGVINIVGTLVVFPR